MKKIFYRRFIYVYFWNQEMDNAKFVYTPTLVDVVGGLPVTISRAFICVGVFV